MFRILCYIASGYFFNMVGFISFMHEDFKPFMMAVFTVPAVISLLAGIAASGSVHWKRDAGIMLLCAAGIGASFGFTMYDMTRPEMQGFIPPNVRSFNDWTSGSGYLAALAVFGGGLLALWKLDPRART